jgi:hypothetical protein
MVAAERLGANVSYGTLEKILSMQRIVADNKRSLRVRLAARGALEALATGEPVNHLHQRVRALVLTDDLERAAREEADGLRPKTSARVALEELQHLEDSGATPAQVKRAAAAALTAIRRERRDSRRLPGQSRK